MKKYPIDFNGEQIDLVLIKLKKRLTYDEATDYINQRGLLPAHMSHLATFQKRYPKAQERSINCTIFALGTLHENYHVPYISGNKINPEYMDFWDIRELFPCDHNSLYLAISGSKTKSYIALEETEQKNRKEAVKRKEKEEQRMKTGPEGQSKTKIKLIKKLLQQATPMQLLAVREYLGRYVSVYGYDSMYYINIAAREAFDEGRYDDPNIAYLIKEGELVEILQNPEKVNQICQKVKANAIR